MQFSCVVCLLFGIFSPVLSLNCERVWLKDAGIIYPTEQCYAGSLGSSGIDYASTSYQYKCVDGAAKYFTYNNDECSGSGDVSAITDNYASYCGLDLCDVVHVTVYNGVSNEQCLNATSNATALGASERFSAALLLNYCNPMSAVLGLKVVCDDDQAKVLSYLSGECTGAVFATSYIDTSVAVDCNVTLGALGTLTALSAQCDILSAAETEAKKKTLVIIIAAAGGVVLLIVIGVVVFAILRKRSKAGDDQYSEFLDPNQNENAAVVN